MWLPGLAHDGLHADLGLRLAFWAEKESHTAAAHAPEHPEAPEIVAEFFANTVDQRVGVEVGGPRNDGLEGPSKFRCKQPPSARMSPR
jgi:hypothetical protein